MTTRQIAAYVRVSSSGQNEAGQVREIENWLCNQSTANDTTEWYIDCKSGRTTDRPALSALQAQVFGGGLHTVVVYRLDRLSRSIRDGIGILCDWLDKGVRIVATSQQLDFHGPVGKLIAAVLFAVAEMEIEAIRERQAVGIATAKEAGKKWGGSKKGRLLVLTSERIAVIKQLSASGLGKSAISRTVGLSRSTVYRVLQQPEA